MIAATNNRLLEEAEYKYEETNLGVWRRFAYPDGNVFEEFKSHNEVSGIPVLHYTRGICPDSGKRITARGVIAIGRVAIGLFAIGQLSIGLLAIGQLGLGVLFGLGQATTGLIAMGQLAVGVILGIGQFATGFVSIAQLGFGVYVLSQQGLGMYVWDMRHIAPEAEQFFRSLLPVGR